MNDMLIKAARYVSPEYVNKLTERIKELEAQLKAANDYATTLTGTHPDDIHKSRDERIAVLEAQVHAGYEAGWHALRQERDALKAQLKRLQEKPNV
jgi:hypothetical protein